MPTVRDALAIRLQRLTAWAVPATLLQEGGERLRRAQFIVLLTLAVCCWVPVLAPVYWTLGSPASGIAILLAGVTGTAGFVILRLSGSLVLTGHWVLLQLYWVLGYVALRSGGGDSPALIWNLSIPAFALLMLGGRAGIAWLGLATAQVLGIGLAPRIGLAIVQDYSTAELLLLRSIARVSLMLIFFSLAFLYETYKSQLVGEALEANRHLEDVRSTLTREVGLRTQMEQMLQTERDQLKSFNHVMLGREERILELKQQVADLQAQLERLRSTPPQ